jgi:uncharacterized membrane protein YhaH (DUF805 family)
MTTLKKIGLWIWNNLFRWGGRIPRGQYFLLGMAFAFIKPWVNDMSIRMDFSTLTEGIFTALAWNPFFIFSNRGLLAVSLLFIWIGVNLTIKRLRDAGITLWLVLFYFIPFLNLYYFFSLCLLGSVPKETLDMPEEQKKTTKLSSSFVSAIVAGIITALLIIGIIALINRYDVLSAWAPFVGIVGIPVFLGLIAVLMYAFQRQRSWLSCQKVIILSINLFALGILAFQWESLFFWTGCLQPQSPLSLLPVFLIGLVAAVFGGFLGYTIQKNRWNVKSSPSILLP